MAVENDSSERAPSDKPSLLRHSPVSYKTSLQSLKKKANHLSSLNQQESQKSQKSGG